MSAALAAREALGVGGDGPIPDILMLIEDAGRVPVTILRLPGGIAGAYGRKQDHPFIFVNSEESLVRRRFTLAHEFGHHVLRHRGSFDTVDDLTVGASSPAEVQANYFAAAFLAPTRAVFSWVQVHEADPRDLGTVVKLAHYFHVSASAALYRLDSAGLLRQGDKQRLTEALNQGEHTALRRRLALPDDHDSLSEIDAYSRVPRAMYLNAAAVYENGLLAVDRIAELVGKDAAELEKEFAAMGLTPPADEPDY
ncbi:MAG: ImmA/IrrE family metallo-endopeptidase [Thermoleophilia bacterium]